MMVSLSNAVGIELYSYANAFFCFGLKTCLFLPGARQGNLRVRSIGRILEQECEGLRLKITFTRILMLSEYK